MTCNPVFRRLGCEKTFWVSDDRSGPATCTDTAHKTYMKLQTTSKNTLRLQGGKLELFCLQGSWNKAPALLGVRYMERPRVEKVGHTGFGGRQEDHAKQKATKACFVSSA